MRPPRELECSQGGGPGHWVWGAHAWDMHTLVLPHNQTRGETMGKAQGDPGEEEEEGFLRLSTRRCPE